VNCLIKMTLSFKYYFVLKTVSRVSLILLLIRLTIVASKLIFKYLISLRQIFCSVLQLHFLHALLLHIPILVFPFCFDYLLTSSPTSVPSVLFCKPQFVKPKRRSFSTHFQFKRSQPPALCILSLTELVLVAILNFFITFFTRPVICAVALF